MYVKLKDISVPKDFFDADRWYVCDVMANTGEVHISIMIPGYKSFEDAKANRMNSSFLFSGEELIGTLIDTDTGKTMCPVLSVALAD